LHCQIRIEATRRTYAPEDRERLIELFGETHRWKDRYNACFGRTRTSKCQLSRASASSNCRSHAASISMPRQPNISLALKEARCAGVLVQRHGLLSGCGWFPADGSDLLEQGGSLPAPGADLAGVDGSLLSQHGLAAHRSRDFDEIYRYKTQQWFTGWDETLRALLTRQREESLP